MPGMSWRHDCTPAVTPYAPEMGSRAWAEQAVIRSLTETHCRPREDTSWMALGLCKVDPDSFFPEGNVTPAEAALLAKVCATCPVQALCEDYGTRHDEDGYWGGLSRRKRQELRRERAVVAERRRRESGEEAA